MSIAPAFLAPWSLSPSLYTPVPRVAREKWAKDKKTRAAGGQPAQIQH
jgi:hypothetical protein